MAIDNISTQSLKDITNREINIWKFIDKNENDESYKKAAHRRDDHYLFIFQKSGRSRIILDFKEIELVGSVVMCILPGQIHYGVATDNNTEAWLITLDTNLVNNDHRTIFEDHYFQYEPLTLLSPESVLLNECIELILSLNRNRQSLNFIPQVLHSIINACVGMFASAYFQIKNKNAGVLRTHILTQQFKRLLLRQSKIFKSAAGYAAALNITPAYLNEAVGQTTGFTVSFWIQQTIMIEAKRLLYTTDESIKEIAYRLGFSDHAYFSRYFSNIEGRSPLQFRLNYRK